MIPDDHAAIARRMREIEDEREGKGTICFLCLGTGWCGALVDGIARWVTCEACGNPEGTPCP